MNRPWVIIVGGILVGIAAYACVYLAGTSTERAMSKSDKPALAWLQHEYHLSDEQYAKVRDLYEAYLPKCAENCRRIDEKNTEIQSLLAATNVVTPEIKQALADSGRVRAECQANMMAHFYAVAQVMPPDEDRRYLAWVHREVLTPGKMVPSQPSLPAANPVP
jgi:uncharacterized membrane protein